MSQLIPPLRVQWSLADQVLVSGVNFVSGIVLIRALGLEAFGIYAMVLVCIQFLAGVQQSLILSPLMSMFDQRGETGKSSYLYAVLVHQAALSVLIAVLLGLVWMLPTSVIPEPPVSYGVALALVVASQLQDLARRYFFVTERPGMAFASDLLAHGGRLVVLVLLASGGALTLQLVWDVMLVAAIAGLLLLLPDVLQIRPDTEAVRQVTLRHRRLSGWMLGNMFVAWFSEIGFVLFVIGAMMGPAELGAVRAVLNLILVVNLLIQSLENFVPSGASRRLVSGGPAAMMDYLRRIGVLGGVAILVITVILMLFADPIMALVYGHSVPNQVLLLGMFGVFLAMGYVASVTYSGLRALEMLGSAFLVQMGAGVFCVLVTVPAVNWMGDPGAVLALLLARVLMAGSLLRILRRSTRPDGGGTT